jgi:hypothetical protein
VDVSTLIAESLDGESAGDTGESASG